MSSLRLALKMSMAGAPKSVAPNKTDFDSIPDPPVGKSPFLTFICFIPFHKTSNYLQI